MSFILCVPVFLIIAIVNPQFVPSSFETAFVEEQEMKGCNTISSKEQGKFKVHDKDSGKKQHKDCVCQQYDLGKRWRKILYFRQRK